MANEPTDLPAKLNDLGELIARSQKLKEQAAQMLRDSAALDERIEKTLKSSINTAKRNRPQ